MNYPLVFAVLILLGVMAGPAKAEGAQDSTPKPGISLPRGIYWPGEYTFNRLAPEARWKKIEEVMDLLAAKSVNTIWITHHTTADLAEWSRRAAKRNIKLVAYSGELSPTPDWSKEAFPGLTDIVQKAWGTAPAPLAWSFGDEPPVDLMERIDDLAGVFKSRKMPTVVITTINDIPYAGKLLRNIDTLAIDFYPFFGDKNPNGPNEYTASVQFYLHNLRNTRYWAGELKKDYWMMGQGSQEAWGPFKLDAEGNVVLLPGGAQHWRMPTPAEIAWQGWSALAMNSKGFFYYSLLMWESPEEGLCDTFRKPTSTVYAVTKETNTNSPNAMIYPNGKTTPQLEAIGEFFKQMQLLDPVLTKLKPAKKPFAYLYGGWPRAGDLVECFEADDGEKYLMVVNGDFTAQREISIVLESTTASETQRVTDLKINGYVKMQERETKSKLAQEPFKLISVGLAPGEGTIIQLKRKK